VEGLEPVTATVAAAVVVRYLVVAVEAFGERVLDKTVDKAVDAAAEESAGVGRRLLAKLLRRDGRSGEPATAVPAKGEPTTAEPTTAETERRELAVVEAVRDLVRIPADEEAQIVVKAAVRTLLESDPALLAEVARLLEQAPSPSTTVAASGPGAVAVGRDNSGVIVTGSGNTIPGTGR